MLPPQRFYYNLGEFLRDMNPEPSNHENDPYFDMGSAMARVFLGVRSELPNDYIAMKLAGELMARINGIDFDDDEEDDEELA